MQKVFNRVDCVNGKHPRSTLHFLTQFQCKSCSVILTYDSVNPLVVLIVITLPYLFRSLDSHTFFGLSWLHLKPNESCRRNEIFFLVFGSHKWPIVIKIVSRRMRTNLRLLASQIFCLQSFVCHDSTCLIAINYAYNGVVYAFVLFFFVFVQKAAQ